MLRRRLILALALGSFVLCRAALAEDERLYTTLYPYYAELCAVSQILKKPGFGADIRGGPGGHSVLWLNGVCRDKDAHYPTLAMCEDGPKAAQQGVGLSVNAHFKNANWIATENRDFFFHGGLPLNARLTRAGYEKAQAQAKAMGILDGIVFHDEVFDDMPAGWSRADYMYEVSIATDYAIDFGRDRYCARVPLSSAKMSLIVDRLNAINAVYKDGQKEFVWDVLENNCSHMTHNALAAVGVWPNWETDQFILFAALDFPVPKNEFVNLMRRTNDFPLANLDTLYDDATARGDLMAEDWLPFGPGALAEQERVRQQNDVYDTDPRLIFYDEPIFGTYQTHFDEIFSEPRYTDLRANLQYFAALYRQIEASRRPISAWLNPRIPFAHGANANRVPPEKRREFPALYARYYRYVVAKSEDVKSRLAALRAAESAQR